MTKPVRLKLSRTRGFRLQELSKATNGLPAAKVDRSTNWGNPWIVGERVDMRRARLWGWTISPAGRKHVCKSQTEAYRRFTHALMWDSAIHDHVRKELGGRNLACWCELDEPCHAEIILWLANSKPEQIAVFQEVFDQVLINSAEEIANR